MKWVSLLKDIKEKVGLSQSASSSPSAGAGAPSGSGRFPFDAAQLHGLDSSSSRDKYELEFEFKKSWDNFRSSSSEKEKEEALNVAVDIFCGLVKQQANGVHVVNSLVETHIFSFVVGRAFVTDIEKLKHATKNKSLLGDKVLVFFSETTKEGIKPGSNLLYAVEILVSEALDKQPLLHSGILCSLIQILNALLVPDQGDHDLAFNSMEATPSSEDNSRQVRRLEVEGSIVHIMKALASHPSAAQSLIEDDSLLLLFHMVANGSLDIFSRFKRGLIPLHTIQLHRHAMQILGLLLVNDSGSTAKYIHRHHLIKVLLMAVKDFNPDNGDPAYTMGIVDLLLECVELSYRPESGGVKLREDIHNAHGYQFLVQFALVLSSMHKKQSSQHADHLHGDRIDSSYNSAKNSTRRENISPARLSPSLSRLLDVLVNLAQLGPGEFVDLSGGKGSRSAGSKIGGHGKRRTLSSDKVFDEVLEKGNTKVKDLEAIQMLQDIFLKADSTDLQAEVLNRMFKIFSSHLENYMICQQLRTIPLFILNMAGFPVSLQEIILKILEYAVTVANCVPEQELLSLCCLLQQPINTDLKQTILSFFVKLLSFDQQYKKVLREVGVLEVLLDDLKQHKFLIGPEQTKMNTKLLEKNQSSDSFKKHMEEKDAILSSPKLMGSGSGKYSIFEDERTIAVAWDCLVSLIKKAESNQSTVRSTNTVIIVFPFLVSDAHRLGVLRLLSCLIMEDISQAHPEELGSLVEVLKSGMVTSVGGSQYKLHSNAKCDILAALWRILGANYQAQRVFGEATGFSLLVTSLHSFENDGELENQSSLLSNLRVFCFVMCVVTAGVYNNPINRLKLHTVLSSHTFLDLLCDSGLLCVDFEKHVIHVLLELALEIVVPPSAHFQLENTTLDTLEAGHAILCLSNLSGSGKTEKERIYNADAIRVLIRSVLFFTPKMQLEVLSFIGKLARASSFNQENLTSTGCVGLLLDMIHPFLGGSSSLLSHALNIVEILGAYRLSASELRLLVRYILQVKLGHSRHLLTDMMENIIKMQDMPSDNVPLAPFMEMNMNKVGHASIQVPMGERTWPPAAGYTFVCWFQIHNFFNNQATIESEPKHRRKQLSGGKNTSASLALRIFSVSAVDDANICFADLYLHDDGTLTLATSSSSSISFTGLELVEGKWHHLAVIHSKPNALAGLFQASVAYVYLDGKLRHTGKLGYSPSPFGKPLQVTIGTPASSGRISELRWRLGSCYLFEEVLTSGSIFFMFILGRSYRGLFQDTDLLQFVPNQACAGGSMALLDSLEAEMPLSSTGQKSDGTGKPGAGFKADRSGIVWDLERLKALSAQLSGKKMIFAFDGTPSEAFLASGTISMHNLVDPLSAAASPMGGIPRFGRYYGDIYICSQCVIGNSIRTAGGMAVVLALVEASMTKDMLHMALSLLACALHQSPQNLHDMQVYRGYHLLALFLHRRMSLFDHRCLEIFFKIAACEASFAESQNMPRTQSVPSPRVISHDPGHEDISLSKFSDDAFFTESQNEFDDFSTQKDSFSHISELENVYLQAAETSNCIVLSNPDMVEHVLLDWTLWVTSPVQIQVQLLGFLERLVSMHWYRNHNLTVLRKINLVQHLLVTLQRGDIEVPVIEKLVVLLGVILEDGFLVSELDLVVRFVTMTFEPPELISRHQIVRETMGKHVIVRNMLLEMLIDLQVTITSDEFLEQWHKIVSVKLITYFLDEAVHPTSMRWVMTLLGVCLTSSSMFVARFRNGGGYQSLLHALPSFYDSPEIYYTLFCLLFGKPVYPRLPEVRMIDFHTLMKSDGSYAELKFIELLEPIIAMAECTFERLTFRSIMTYNAGNFSQFARSLVGEIEGMAGELQGEALVHKTYASRLMGGESAAPAATTSVLRFMVDLAKMCPPFAAACRRVEFLECCVDLYFSCARASCAMKRAKDLSEFLPDVKNLNDSDDAHSSQLIFSSLPPDQEQSDKISINIESFPYTKKSTSCEDTVLPSVRQDSVDNISVTPSELSNILVDKDLLTMSGQESDNTSTTTSSTQDASKISDANMAQISLPLRDSLSTMSSMVPDSPVFSEKSNSVLNASSPVLAFTSWIGSNNGANETKVLAETPSLRSSISSVSDYDTIHDLKAATQGSLSSNNLFVLTPKVLLEIDELGYGGGHCSSAATAVLDFVAEVLADIATEQIKAATIIEAVLDSVPLFVDIDTALVFQGLCLNRMMNFLERRLLRDDEEERKKLDKNRWSVNLDAICYMIVDRVYTGAVPQPGKVLRTLEFLLSILQLSNKDGRIEEATTPGKGLLSITRGNRQLEPYIHGLLKTTNRMVMYCFLPSFLATIGEEDFLSCLGWQVEPRKNQSLVVVSDGSGIDICTVLQLLIAHKRLILCPSNLDTDLICCLCVNLIYLLRDKRQIAQNMAVDIFKYLLFNRRASLEELLVTKPNQGQQLDILHGGFDRLLTGSSAAFFDWLEKSEQTISKVLEQCGAIMWVQFIASSMKFPGMKIKGMESQRKREMSRKSRETAKQNLKHWQQIKDRRDTLELLRDEMATELRILRQDKYGWVLHAESEWQSHLQQLAHERGIFPIRSCIDPEWELCPIEGPYRMRKKLERCLLKIDTIQNLLDDQVDIGALDMKGKKREGGFEDYGSPSDSFLHLLTDASGETQGDEAECEESSFKEAEEFKEDDIVSGQIEWNDDRCSSINEASLHSALEFGVKSSVNSVQMTDSCNARSDMGSPWQSLSVKTSEEKKNVEDKSTKELLDNGEYLIRPYLEPLERIRYKYNCERVVGLDKHDGIFLIGELCLYVIENFYIDIVGSICEKECEDDLSVIDLALGVKKDMSGSSEFQSKSSTGTWGGIAKSLVGGRAWAYHGGAWGKEKVSSSSNLPHLWRMWKLDSVHELLKRDFQLRPVSIEIFSMDGCNDLLVFHKKERDEVFKNLIALNLPRNSMLDTTISGTSKHESNEGSRLFKIMAKSFSKRWQNGEISNFQYLMHLNTLAGRGYSDLTQYPVFPWILADYESEVLDFSNPKAFRKLDKPMGCQTYEGEEEFRKRYESWDDPDVPKFHYGSHYSSAGIVLFYLLRLPPFSTENLKLQGGQFDHADRLFNSIRETWYSAAGKGNTSDVKELIPEFFYMPEFLENQFNLDLGEKQSGEKVNDVSLPPWAKGSTREFIRKHREALESDYVSENLHHWIDLIFGFKQRGKAAEEAVNVFYHYTYEGNVDIDAVIDPAMKASILAQINHFGQTPKQLFQKPHPKRRLDKKGSLHPLRYSSHLVSNEIRKSSSSICQIVVNNDKILVAGPNSMLKPVTYSKYISWAFPDRSLRFLTYDQEKLLSTHENLHLGNQIQTAGITGDGQVLATGGDDGVLSVWQISLDGTRGLRNLNLKRSLCAHTAKITCLSVCQSYSIIVSGSDDCTVIIWDLSRLTFVKQLSEFPAPVSAIFVNDLTGEILTAAGVVLAVWSVNGDCLAVVNTSQLPSDFILSVSSTTFSDWLDTNWFVTGHQSGAVEVWHMVHSSEDEANGRIKSDKHGSVDLELKGKGPEYRLVLHKVLKSHKHPVTALHITSDLKQLLSGDSGGHLLSWTLPDAMSRNSSRG